MKKVVVFLSLLGFLSVFSSAFAVPAPATTPTQLTIPYRKTVKLAKPRNYWFRFSIYDAPSSGREVWFEEKKLRLKSRTLSHRLGSRKAFENGVFGPLDFPDQHWVQVAYRARGGWKVLGDRDRLAPTPTPKEILLADGTAADWFLSCKGAKQGCGLFSPCCGSLKCEFLAWGPECRHDPPLQGEACTIFSGCNGADLYCKGFQDGLAGRCTPYSKLGESCDGLFTLCGDRLACRQDPRDLTIGHGRCFPTFSGTITDGQLDPWGAMDDLTCLASYSPAVHRALPKLLEGDNIDETHAMTFGKGVGMAFGGGATFETGGGYGDQGSFACYKTNCLIAETDIGVSAFVSVGEYEGYDYLDGEDYQVYAGGSLILGWNRALVYDLNWTDPQARVIGDVTTLSLEIEEPVPMPEVGNAICHTELNEVIKDWQVVTGPTAVCNNVEVCAGAASCDAEANVDGGSTASGGGSPTLIQIPAGPYAIGETPVTLQVSDNSGATAECAATVDVHDCTPPLVTCPPLKMVECQSNRQAFVTPDPPSVVDCTSYTIAGPAAGSYPLGTTDVVYRVEDAYFNTSSCTTSIAVFDTAAPVIGSITASPAVLWPPNHTLRSVQLVIEAADSCDPQFECAVVEAQSSEDDRNKGDGKDQPGDISIVGPRTVELRAERSGTGRGRVYTIAVECRDTTAGNVSRGEVQVTVPHDWSGQATRSR